MFKILHSGDLHFSVNPDKLAEVIRTTDFLVEHAEGNPPDCIVLGGDSVDERDGRIRLDSDCTRAAISFMERCADIAPVIIIRGTKTHDRATPEIFSHLKARYPIRVATDVEQIALMSDGSVSCTCFVGLAEGIPEPAKYCRAVFTLVPELDKTYMEALDSIRSGNMSFREAAHDLFAGFGLINDQFTAAGIPTIMVLHGMITGASYSSGQSAVGEGLELGLNDLHAARCSATMLDHVHKHQIFPGHVAYSGSTGRLNFGEQEDKGFLVWDFEGPRVTDMRFIQTPARRFCFGEVPEYTGALDVYLRAEKLADDCNGSDVRFRLQVPGECRGDIDRDRLEQIFLIRGANKVKIELSVIPKVRTRAEGISKTDSLVDKVVTWGATVGEVIPDNVLALASIIEGQSAEELLIAAQLAVDAPGSIALSVVDNPVILSPADQRREGVRSACNKYFENQGGPKDLFGEPIA